MFINTSIEDVAERDLTIRLLLIIRSPENYNVTLFFMVFQPNKNPNCHELEDVTRSSRPNRSNGT